MNARRVISLLTVSLAMGLGGLGVAAWYTETGSALLVTRLVGLVPGLSVGVLRGTLSSQMLADTLAYTSPAVTVTSTKGKFRLSLADLLRGRVLSPGIELQGVHVIYRGNTATAPGSASVNIPIPIMLRAVDITDAVVTINDLDPVRVSYALAARRCNSTSGTSISAVQTSAGNFAFSSMPPMTTRLRLIRYRQRPCPACPSGL